MILAAMNTHNTGSRVSERITAISRISRLEVIDLNFELAFPIYLRHDGSGEKGFDTLVLGLAFHVERECPRYFPQ